MGLAYCYYQNKNGKIVDSSQVQSAFFVLKGISAREDIEGYDTFVNGLMGDVLFEVEAPTVEKLVSEDRWFDAVDVYQKKHPWLTSSQATRELLALFPDR